MIFRTIKRYTLHSGDQIDTGTRNKRKNHSVKSVDPFEMDDSGRENDVVTNDKNTHDIPRNTDESEHIGPQTARVHDWLQGSALRLLGLQVASGKVYCAC